MTEVVKQPPQNRQAEWNVIGAMMTQPQVTAEIIGQQMEPDDFFYPDTRLIFSQAVELYYADDPVDAVMVGERLKDPLSRQWQVEPGEVAAKLHGFVASQVYSDAATAHARLVKRLGDKRRIVALLDAARQQIDDPEMLPEEIGDFLTTEASRITTGRMQRGEVLDWMEVGMAYGRELDEARQMREQGIIPGVRTQLPFMDEYWKGILPTELCMVAGEPGVGKSSVCWEAGMGFARQQMHRPAHQRVGTLLLSLEMGLIPSSGRIVTSLTGIDSGKLREGNVNRDEIRHIMTTWAQTRDLPIHFNFASNFKLSQLRALIVEAIRRHNVGFVILDHFRQIDPDRRVNNANQEDEFKARFLKEEICKDLNVAMMCLAHTVKMRRDGGDGRPSLADLRGSYQVAAYCDHVSFVYRPVMYASEDDIADGLVDPTDAELIHAKNRHGALGSAPFTFDPAKMQVRAK
jgi:replicative DNA helicase